MGTERGDTPSDPDWAQPPPATELEAPSALPDAADPAAGPPGATPASSSPPRSAPKAEPGTMLPGREHRRTKVERGLVRIIATAGIVGIDVLLGAILVSQDVAGWIVGLVIGLVSVILAAVLWSSRSL
jgi:hypothetical protein